MTKEKKTTEQDKIEKTKEQKAIKNSDRRQEIRKNMDLSVLNLNSGIFESSPSISLVEIFCLGKCVGVSRDVFLILSQRA